MPLSNAQKALAIADRAETKADNNNRRCHELRANVMANAEQIAIVRADIELLMDAIDKIAGLEVKPKSMLVMPGEGGN